MKKKIMSLLLCGVMAFSTFGCAPQNDGRVDATIWTVTGTEKILRSQIDYSSYHSSKTLKIGVFKNENEAGQIMLTPKTKVKSYTVEAADLYSASGDKLPKEAFTLFHEKYIQVLQIFDTAATTPAGWYPDALLPFETAIEYGENTIEAGHNQGVWVNVKPSKDQKAGVFKGNFTVKMDASTFTVPVEVEVYDYALDDERHTKSSFMISASAMGWAELDTTTDMYEKYYDFMLDHRIDPQHLPGNDMNDSQISRPANEKAFLDYAEKYTKDPRCNSFNLPFEMSSCTMYEVFVKDGKRYTEKEITDIVRPEVESLYSTESEIKDALTIAVKNYSLMLDTDEILAMITQELRDSGLSGTTLSDEAWKAYNIALPSYRKSKFTARVDFNKFANTIRAMAQRSLESGVNLFKKAGTYYIFFDEYDGNGTEDMANYNLRRGNETCEKIAVEMQSMTCADPVAFEQEHGISFEDFWAECMHDCANIKHKVVGRLEESKISVDKACSVPTIDNYDIESTREKYAAFDAQAYPNDSELWTYTCVFPKIPFPTYHTEDKLLSARLINWMMYEYNVVGLLFWDSTLFSKHDYPYPNVNQELQDYYGLASKWVKCNGDGYLVYPGREYGIDGPVASIRLKAIMDGSEDYDLLYQLEEFYKERGVSGDDFDSVYKLLNRELYTGTTVRHRAELEEHFASSRKALAEMLVAANGAGMIIEKYEVEDGVGTAVVSAPSALAVKYNGTTLTNGVENDGVTTYTVEISLDKEENIAQFSTVADGKNYQVSLILGGKSIMIEGGDLLDRTTFITGGECEVEEIDGINSLVLNFADNDGTLVGMENSLLADVDVKSYNINSLVTKVIIRIKLIGVDDEDDDEKVDVLVYTKSGSTSAQEAATLTVGEGDYTILEIPVSKLSTKAGKVDIIRIYVESPTAKSIAIGSIAVEG